MFSQVKVCRKPNIKSSSIGNRAVYVRKMRRFHYRAFGESQANCLIDKKE